MTDISKLLQQAGVNPGSFPFTSRYKDIEVTSIPGADEVPIVYLRRRFVPQADSFSLLQIHTVKDGDRLDNIASQYLGDPEKFWQICDANNVLHPGELTETLGTQIKITLPAGIPGYNNA
ncbi:LysM peptidoglycan-binding domain-containing protein [Mucilaginibacter agri]|uniref:LysM domain-containing protein n=1 Tax=Mucilaginibacter agri TaxID=2695265 RepID=A0A965ZLB4_9SPHI|nr:LysM peptidoglycan-binding domain-containing protein [Mucilaginibacter agri]NCD71691.1 LysM domain-containing protein [Mucilaginibacter agri]